MYRIEKASSEGSKDGETVPVKVMVDEQLGKSYTSVLATMVTVISTGLDYIEGLEKGYVYESDKNPEEGLQHE